MEIIIIYYREQRSGFIEHRRLGFIHIYFGQGVGKTTRAVGLAIRAAGQGLRVDFVQFMKSGNSGEVAVLGKVPAIRYRCPGRHPLIMSQGPEDMHYDHAAKALRYALEAVERGTDMLICDEILNTIIFNTLQKDQALGLMETCKEKTELVMTGTDAPPELIESADYVTEFVQLKHPYYRGARARMGVEY